MDDKWKGSGYNPDKAWAEIKQEQWKREHPGSWKDGWIVLGGVLDFLGTIACLALFVLKMLRIL